MKTKTIECPSCGQRCSLEIGTEEAAYKCPKCSAEFTVSLIEDGSGDRASAGDTATTATQCLTSAPISGPTPRRWWQQFFKRDRKADTPPATNALAAKPDFVIKALLSVIALCLVFISVMQFLAFQNQKGALGLAIEHRKDVQRVEIANINLWRLDDEGDLHTDNSLPVSIDHKIHIDDEFPIKVMVDDASGPIDVNINGSITVEKIEDPITVEKIEDEVTIDPIQPLRIDDSVPIDVRIQR